MMRRLSFGVALLLVAVVGPAAGMAQDPAHMAVAVQKPRFVAAWPAPGKVIDASDAAVLQRRVSVDVTGRPLGEVLREVARQARVDLVYDPDRLPTGRTVSLHVRAITVLAALTEVLAGTRLDVVVRPTGQLTIVPAELVDGAVRRLAPGTITGRVTDSASGQPIAGADVFLDGTDRRTLSGEQGEFRLAEVPPGGYTLVVRRIGYGASRRPVTVGDGESVELAVALTAQPTRLDELVTTATGDQRRLEIGNAIAQINADSITRAAPVTTLTDLLSGRAAGVQIRPNGGMSGATGSIRIRGQNSFTLANDPLLYIDGVRVDNTTARDRSATEVNGFPSLASGRLNDLNPEEIESIEIVKGPSAATLYGTDAANGVILVRTKRGSAGRTTWRAYAERGLLNTPQKFEPGYHSWGTTPEGATTQCALMAAAAGDCTIDSLTTWSPLTHPETTPLETGSRGQYGLQVSGGVDRFKYFLAGDYEHETGPLRMPDAEVARISVERGGVAVPEEQLRPNALQRMSLRGTATADLGATADVTLATGLTAGSSRIPSNSIFASGIWNAGYRDQNDGMGLFGRPGELFARTGTEDVLHSTSSLAANWRPQSWLQTRATVGLDLSTAEFDGLNRRGEGTASLRTGFRSTQRTSVALYSADLGATATAMLNPALSSRTSVGLQYHRRNLGNATLTATGLAPGSETVAGAEVITGSEQTVETVVAGAYLEQMVGVAERLFLTGALRADGGSAFGRDFESAFYPKAAASWLALQDRGGWLASLRLRAAYGASGVQPSATAALAQIGLTTEIVDGAPASGGRLTTPGNADLKPERTAELEAGADLELWGDRVRLEATYYRRRSTDALVNVPLATSTGLTSRIENLGAVQNQGVEGLMTVRVLTGQAVSWDLTLNGSVNSNRLLRLAPGIVVSPNQGNRNVPGYPLFGLWELPILGYDDANGDGLLAASEVVVGDTLVFVGSAVPRHLLALSSGLSLWDDRLRLGVQFDYRGGHWQRTSVESIKCDLGSCRGANDPTAPLADQAANVANRTTGSNGGYVADGDYLRWRELSLTYTVPVALVRRLGVTSASLTLAGRNLGLWTRLPSGVDPEAPGNPPSPTFDFVSPGSGAPLPRYFLLRLNLGL